MTGDPLQHPTFAAGRDRFRTLSELVDDMTVVVGIDGRLLYVSPSAQRLLGYDPSGAIGTDVFQLVDDDDRGALRSSFGELVAGRRLSVALELQAITADGTPIDVEIVATGLNEAVGGIVVNVRDVTERKRIEREAQEVRSRYATIMESLVDGIMMVDADGVIVAVNNALVELFNASKTWILGRKLEEVLHLGREAGWYPVDSDLQEVPFEEYPVLQSLATGERCFGFVHGIHRPDGPMVWLRVNSQGIGGEDGQPRIGAVASFSDITEARNAGRALREEQQFLQVLLDNLEEGIVACDENGLVTLVNPAAQQMFGFTAETDPTGSQPTGVWLRGRDGSPMSPEKNPLLRALAGERLRESELVLVATSGSRKLITVNAQALFDDARHKLGAVAAIHDVTEQKRNEERLADLALHDPLTGVANRTLLADRLGKAVGDLTHERNPDSTPEGPSGLGGSIAVFLLDLDDFKEINDALGHDVGDEVLVAVARRLLAIVRPTDTVARLGGDEFVVVCQVKRGEEEMQGISDRIATALSEPYQIGGRSLIVSASIGGVRTDDPWTDPSTLLARADDAMYSVKWSRRRALPPTST
ncbi:MAG TPA: PAS domain S-box protein [Acidimicrobiales bacterium]|nr:PAS domain S-box protein [Acidimicrobiales bacterium]